SGELRAPARFHQSHCWLNGGMAARGARATGRRQNSSHRNDLTVGPSLEVARKLLPSGIPRRAARPWVAGESAYRGCDASVFQAREVADFDGAFAVWFWPKIIAALTSKHHWLIIACDSCGTVVDLDLRV